MTLVERLKHRPAPIALAAGLILTACAPAAHTDGVSGGGSETMLRIGDTARDAGDNDWDWANIDESNGAQNNGLGPNLGCGPAITPLVASKTTVHEAIDEMQPWHRGGTMANLGLAWGWRVLSPTWQGLWAVRRRPSCPSTTTRR